MVAWNWRSLQDRSRKAATSVSAICLLVLCVIAAQMMFRKSSEWEAVYLQAARDLLRGVDIYTSGTGYAYPPFLAAVAIPFASLPQTVGRILWTLANVVSLIIAVRASLDLALGGRWREVLSTDLATLALVALAGAIALPFALNTAAHQQTDLLIAALIAQGSRYLTMRSRADMGAFFLGLAAAMKGPPLIFFAYALVRTRFRTALLVPAVAIAVNLLPDLVAPSPSGDLWIVLWFKELVLPTQSWNAEAGIWGADLIYNQSLGGTLRRLFAAVPGQDIKLTSYAILGSMLLATAAAIIGNRTRSTIEPQVGPEVGQFACLMLLASPHSSPAHFCVVITPALCLAAEAAKRRSPALLGLLASAGILSLTSNKDLVGAVVYDQALFLGNATWSTALLWVGCFLASIMGAPLRTSPARAA